MNGRFCIRDVLDEWNIQRAIRHITSKHTSCGYDGMQPRELPEYWRKYGKEIRQQILEQRYVPRMAVQRRIPKGNGKARCLEIPTVLDRMLQYAIRSTMQPYYEARFHKRSCGFRIGNGTGEALKLCLDELNKGKHYVADVDIMSFFDKVNHGRLMDAMREDIGDGALYALIRSYLMIKVYCRGHVYRKRVGISQGGPLSPLLANIYLNSLDWYLDGPYRSFVRYADDIIIPCASREEAEDALADVGGYLKAAMGLMLNREKSSVVSFEELTYLGYAFCRAADGWIVPIRAEHNGIRCGERLQDRIRRGAATDAAWWDRLGAFHRGWMNYYRCVPEGELLSYAIEAERIETGEIVLRYKASDVPEEVEGAMWKSRGYVAPVEWYREIGRKRDEEIRQERTAVECEIPAIEAGAGEANGKRV